MKRLNTLAFACLVVAALAGSSELKAQVSGMPEGYITVAPSVSTAQAPVWYNMMSSNPDPLRANRYLKLDGETLNTEQISTGITPDIQSDKYLWRLEAGPSGDGYVVFVNKAAGKKVYAPADVATGGQITVADEGIEWKMADATTLAGATGAVAGQYYFNFEGGAENRYFNAANETTFNYGLISFNTDGSVAKSSGWFFYPVTVSGIKPAQAEKADLVKATLFDSEISLNSNLTDLSKVEIFNVQGQNVVTVAGQAGNINTSALVPGCYYLKATTASGVYTQKIMKAVR